MIAIAAAAYHAHIYFSPDRAAAAATLQARARAAFEGLAEVHPLVPRPIGPHATPMFEINFAHDQRETVIAWLERHHGDMSVLLHPVTEDELADHTEHVAWLGERQALDLAKL